MAFSRNTAWLASLVAASLWMFGASVALAQQTGTNTGSAPSANSQSSGSHKSGGSSHASSSSGDNAFPLAQSEAAAKAAANQNQPQQTSPQGSSTHLNQPGSGTSSGNAAPAPKKPSSAQANPFPEAQSEAAAKADSGASESANPQLGSPSTGYSSSNANLPPSALGQGGSNFHAKLDTFTRDQTMDGRIEDDLKVADFYMKNGNYRGAMLRYKDALRYDPQNDTALFGVAEVTCKQNQTAAAMALFKSYFTDNPQGKYALKAEKMLAHPGKCRHNF